MKTHSTPLLYVNVERFLKTIRTKHYLSPYPPFVHGDKNWETILRLLTGYNGRIMHITCMDGLTRGSHMMWVTYANGKTIQIDDESDQFMICDIGSDNDPIFFDK